MTVRARHWKDSNDQPRSTWVVDLSVRQPNGTIRRVVLKAPTQSEVGARRFERQVLEQLRAGTFGVVPKKVPTLNGAIEDYTNWSKARNNKPSTLKAKERILKYNLLPVLGGMRLDAIDERHVDALRVHLEEEDYAPKTVIEVLGNLKTILKFAVERGYRTKLPAFRMPKNPKAEAEWLDADECERFLAAAAYWPERFTFLLLGLDTGLRAGELLALKWQDIDFTRKQIHVRRTLVAATADYGTPKSGHARIIGVTGRALAAVKSEKHLRGDFVFCHPDGKPFLHGHTHHWAAAACKRAGLAKTISTHGLRHTCCALMVMAGVHAEAIKAHFGWASDEMLRTYMHLSPSHLRSAVEALDRLHGVRKGAHNAVERR